jgi:hypothetical protein
MNKLIFETLLAEASFRVAEKTITGVNIDEAISEVSAEMELDSVETSELTARVKKAPKPKAKPVIEDESDDSNVEDIIDSSDELNNTIEFDSEEELETAMGVLMYKGIPWVNRGTTSVTFMTPDQVREAHEALKRRWDFINRETRTVACICFDNIEDYSKVLDFIASKNMAAIPSNSDKEILDDDLDLELAREEADHKLATKLAKKEGLPLPEKLAHEMSYRALHKDAQMDIKSLDPFSDSSARSVHIVKRWK